MKCTHHPEIETNLTCGKCGKPICRKCAVQTPVDSRCTECAHLSRIPTYRVTATYYFRAIAAGLGSAIVCGYLWHLIQRWLATLYFNLLIAPAIGFAVAEIISLAVNRKRGTGLAIVAGVSLVLSYFVSGYFFGHLGFFWLDILALALGVIVSVTHIR